MEVEAAQPDVRYRKLVQQVGQERLRISCALKHIAGITRTEVKEVEHRVVAKGDFFLEAPWPPLVAEASGDDQMLREVPIAVVVIHLDLGRRAGDPLQSREAVGLADEVGPAALAPE